MKNILFFVSLTLPKEEIYDFLVLLMSNWHTAKKVGLIYIRITPQTVTLDDADSVIQFAVYGIERLEVE